MGTPTFAVPILEALILDETIDVVGVVTQPDRKVGRKQIITPPPVKELAVKNNIKVYQPEKLSGSEEMAELIALNADLIVMDKMYLQNYEKHLLTKQLMCMHLYYPNIEVQRPFIMPL